MMARSVFNKKMQLARDKLEKSERLHRATYKTSGTKTNDYTEVMVPVRSGARGVSLIVGNQVNNNLNSTMANHHISVVPGMNYSGQKSEFTEKRSIPNSMISPSALHNGGILTSLQNH